jgi:sugar lactone lactonase YvrE
MYALDNARVVYTIDLSTGAKTTIGTISSNAGTTAGLAYDPISQTMYVSSTGNDSLYTLDLSTFQATLVGAYGNPTILMHGIEWDDSTGTLWGASGDGATNNNFYNINKTTGAATAIGSTGLLSFVNLGYDSANDRLFATSSSTDSFYSINRATGAATLIGALGGPTNPNGMAFNKDDGTMYLIDNSTDQLYKIDLATGTALSIGSTGAGNLLGLVYVADVPEPSSLGAIAAMSLVALRRRR